LGESQQEVVSQYNGKYLENIGLLKMDFLGLRNLSVIKNCIKIIVAKARKEKKEIEPMFDNFLKTMSFTPPLDDQLAYEKVLQTADTS
jgi:DNA polymerase-3 subunit alpha